MSNDFPPLSADVALVIMAKVPGHGAAKTRLASILDDGRRAELAAAFLLDKVDQVSGLGAGQALIAFTPVTAVAPLARLVGESVGLIAQVDGDLGDRLHAASAELFASGYASVVLLDADTPNLPTAYVREAVARLTAGHPLVLGPAHDGGYYLIGLGAPAPALFRDIPWSTSVVLERTLERARAAGLVPHLLPPWYDVDEAADLERLHRDLAEPPIGSFDPTRTRALLLARGVGGRRG
jgi:hypothetical protein